MNNLIVSRRGLSVDHSRNTSALLSSAQRSTSIYRHNMPPKRPPEPNAPDKPPVSRPNACSCPCCHTLFPLIDSFDVFHLTAPTAVPRLRSRPVAVHISYLPLFPAGYQKTNVGRRHCSGREHPHRDCHQRHYPQQYAGVMSISAPCTTSYWSL